MSYFINIWYTLIYASKYNVRGNKSENICKDGHTKLSNILGVSTPVPQ